MKTRSKIILSLSLVAALGFAISQFFNEPSLQPVAAVRVAKIPTLGPEKALSNPTLNIDVNAKPAAIARASGQARINEINEYLDQSGLRRRMMERTLNEEEQGEVVALMREIIRLRAKEVEAKLAELNREIKERKSL